jgi:hypothetical protein
MLRRVAVSTDVVSSPSVRDAERLAIPVPTFCQQTFTRFHRQAPRTTPFFAVKPLLSRLVRSSAHSLKV